MASTPYDCLWDARVTPDLVTMSWQPAWPISLHQCWVSGKWIPGWEVKNCKLEVILF